MRLTKILLVLMLAMSSTLVFAQINTVITSVPFLGISPFSNALGMSGINVVSTGSNSQNSVEFNPAGMFQSRMNVSAVYVPRISESFDVENGYLANLSGFYNLNDRHALGFSAKKFDLGSWTVKDFQGNEIGENSPEEYDFGIAYAYQASKHFSLGLNVNYFHSILVSQNIIDARASNIRPGTGLTFGVGFLYKNDFSLLSKNIDYSIGLAVQDIGQKVSYVTNGNGDYIPTNLALGNTFRVKELFPKFDLELATQFSKLLVPTPSTEDTDGNGIEDFRERDFFEAMTSSFNDAPNGFREEIQEINITQTLEGVYHISDNWQAALRLGYFYEAYEKGARQYVQTSGQIRFKEFYGNIGYIFLTENSFYKNQFAFNIGYEVGL